MDKRLWAKSVSREMAMLLEMCRAKIHRATVTHTDLHYVGSIKLPPDVMAAVGMLPFEKVDVVNVMTGARFSTYAVRGKPREVRLMGAAARLAEPGDLIIVFAYALMDEKEARVHRLKIAMMGPDNRVRHVRKMRA